jgi:hypothetical protein
LAPFERVFAVTKDRIEPQVASHFQGGTGLALAKNYVETAIRNTS